MKKEKMTPNRGALVHAPRTAELAKTTAPSENPVAVYLASLAPTGRAPMLSGLQAIAKMVDVNADAITLPWGDIRHKHTQALRAALVDRFSPRTVNRMIASLRGVLKQAWKLGQMDTTAYQQIEIKYVPIGALAPSGRTLSMEEIGQLYDWCAKLEAPRSLRDSALLTALYAGGLRRAEARDADVAKYDRKTGSLTVKGKGRRTRVTYIPSSYRHAIEPWIDHQVSLDRPAMFTNWSQKRGDLGKRISITGVGHVIRELAAKAGVKPFTPHDLRRSFGTHLLDAGADILMVQKLMGHANLSTTAIYDRRAETGKKKAIEFLPTFPGATK